MIRAAVVRHLWADWRGLRGYSSPPLMASAMSGGWAAKLRLVAEPVVLVWSLCMGVLMMRRG